MHNKEAASGAGNTGSGAGQMTAGNRPLRSYDTTQRSQAQGPAHGSIEGDTWKKTIAKSAGQMLNNPPAIAVDVADLEAAERLGLHWLRVLERDDCQVYRVGLVTFRRCSFEIDRRFGKQRALPLDYFSIDGQPPQRRPPEPEPEPEPGAVQLALFGVR